MVDLEEDPEVVQVVAQPVDQGDKDQASAVARVAAEAAVVAAAEEVAVEAADEEAIRIGAVPIMVSSPASATGGVSSLPTPARFLSPCRIRH
jgi:hypothetical protein